MLPTLTRATWGNQQGGGSGGHEWTHYNTGTLATTVNMTLDASSNLVVTGNITGNVLTAGSITSGAITSTGVTTLGGLILPTTGGTAGTLSYYEDSYSWTFTIMGPFSGTLSVNALITRVGNLVTIRLPTNIQTIATVSTQAFQPSTTGDYIPTRFRPTINVYCQCATRDNSVTVPGLYVGLTTGKFTIGTLVNDGALFTNSGNAGVLPSLIKYSLN